MAIKPLSTVVLVSGNGSNLQAIIDAAAIDLPIKINAVISNRSDAYALERAKMARIQTLIHDPALDYKSLHNSQQREQYDQTLIEKIDTFDPKLVLLAGYMRILSEEFVNHYLGRLLNIHPSLLPKFKGLNTHKRALEAGETEHGASVHFVTNELDSGPLIVQARVPILAKDNDKTLAKRVLEQEHHIYPLAIQWFATGRLAINEGKATLDGTIITDPLNPMRSAGSSDQTN